MASSSHAESDAEDDHLLGFGDVTTAVYWDDEDEDDDGHGAGDPDYVDEPDEDDYELEDDDEEDEFHDAEDGEEASQAMPSPTPAQRIMGLIRVLIQNPELGQVYLQPADDEEEIPVRHRRRASPSQYEKVPSDEGAKLMSSGRFGTSSCGLMAKKQLARRILDRELGLGERLERETNQKLMAQSMIPSTKPEMIIHYDEPVYSGQFSDDGNFFYACGHDFKVRMYDTSSPYNWKHYKTVEYPFGQWTLTDASLSPDNKWLAYTSIQSNVSLAPTDPNDTGDPYQLDLASRVGGGTGGGGGGVGGWRSRRSFGIWSVRFSGDGRELVAGTNDQSIVVYDIESRAVLHKVRGHDDDVNAVCFADRSSPHILYSGSDDATIKVWDRRSLGDGREAGAFVGHVEGLTYIDSKGDGRYILSNAKDQTMKLWDLRMVMSPTEFRDRDPKQHTRHSDFDYRWHDYENWFPHPDDNSLVTFRGHSVLRTLIRCHFSPPASTGSRYVYSGSHDGRVYVWNLDATLAGVVDVQKGTAGSRPLDRRFRLYASQAGWSTCVRDVSWHPNAPLLVASAWNGFNQSWGTCTLHSYNPAADDDEAEPKMGRSFNEKLQTDPMAFRDV